MGAGTITELEGVNFHKLEKKTVHFIGSFLVGALVVLLIEKFINDNFDFRIRSLSNRTNSDSTPEPDTVN